MLNFYEFWLCCSSSPVVLAIIGFNQTTYSVHEDAGNVNIRVSVLSGAPVGDVIVTLSTVAGGTATVDRVTMTSPTGAPLRTDTLILTLPASSCTE